MNRISALWGLDAFLERDTDLSPEQRLVLLRWIHELQDDPLPPPAIEVADRLGRAIRVAVLVAADVVVPYRIMATGRVRLLRLERLGSRGRSA